jgi:uncharacterized protein YkwD
VRRPHWARIGRPALFASLLALAATLAGGAGATAGPACPGGGATPAQASPAALEATTLCLINAERRRHGLGPLRLDPRVAAAARGHALDMTSHGYLSHYSRGGGPSNRMARAGFHCLRRGCPRGEDIAWVPRGAAPARTVSMWMHSAGHRYNILYRTYAVGGVGVARRGRNGAMYVLDFAGRGR